MAKRKPRRKVAPGGLAVEFCEHCSGPIVFVAGPFGPSACPFGRVHNICEDAAVVFTALQELDSEARQETAAALDRLVVFTTAEAIRTGELALRGLAN
jgi:hypothetical protein